MEPRPVSARSRDGPSAMLGLSRDQHIRAGAKPLHPALSRRCHDSPERTNTPPAKMAGTDRSLVGSGDGRLT